MDIITLNGRYGVKSFLTPITEHIYLFTTTGQYIQEHLGEDDSIIGIDPEGGPLLYLREYIPYTNQIIQKIEFNDSKYYIIYE